MEPKLQQPMKILGCFLAGLCLSAASLGNHAQPMALGVLCAGLSGWMPIPFASGAALGYWIFWGQAGLQGMLWTAVGLPLCVALGQRSVAKQMPLLLPALAALTVAVSGVVFQVWWRDDTSILMYLLRVAVAFSTAWLFALVLQRREPMADWGAAAIGVMALAQIAPLPFLDLGILAAGAISVLLPLPAAAMAGLALDLAQVTRVPMTAVLCLAFLVRLISVVPKWVSAILPGVMYLLVMSLCGIWDMGIIAPISSYCIFVNR